jgi:hypothetical protein
MEKLTKGFLPARTHRVVRQPNTIRYSMPLEFKPYNSTIIRPLPSPLLENFVAPPRPEDPTKGRVHPALCDCCGHYIIDLRYKCIDCSDYVSRTGRKEKKNKEFFSHNLISLFAFVLLVLGSVRGLLSKQEKVSRNASLPRDRKTNVALSGR